MTKALMLLAVLTAIAGAIMAYDTFSTHEIAEIDAHNPVIKDFPWRDRE